jgi:hypothetical protein
VALPVHRDLVPADHLDAIHPHVADTGLRVARDDARQRDVGPAVFRPADRDRELRQIHVGPAEDGLLARRPPTDRLGGKLGHLGELGQHRKFAEQRVGHLEVHERRDPLADLVQAADAERQRHPPLRAEQVHGNGIA